MGKRGVVLLIGSIIVVILTVLWWTNVVSEPFAALGGAALTFLGYLYAENDNATASNKDKFVVKQKHSGFGDNVGGDKFT